MRTFSLLVIAISLLLAHHSFADSSRDTALASVRQAFIDKSNYKELARDLAASSPQLNADDFLVIRPGDAPAMRAASALFAAHPAPDAVKGDAIAEALKQANDPVTKGMLLSFAPQRYALTSAALRLALVGLLNDHTFVGDGPTTGRCEASINAFNSLAHVLKVKGVLKEADEDWSEMMAPGTFEQVRTERIQRMKTVIDQNSAWFFAQPLNDGGQKGSRIEPDAERRPKPATPQTTDAKQPASVEEPPSSTPWSIIVVLIVAATGLLWLLLKGRK